MREINAWKGPLFDPEKLKSDSGRAELTNLATQYYKVTHDAIRRYDPHHLILGDRYEANAPLTMEIINAARPYVDVLSFQDFRESYMVFLRKTILSQRYPLKISRRVSNSCFFKSFLT